MYLELDFPVHESHQALRTVAATFAREIARPAARKLDRVPADEAPRHPAYRAAMKAGYEAGIHAILIPETLGGMGLDPVGIHVVLEELGWGSASFAVSLAASAFPAFGCTLLAAEDEALTGAFVRPFAADRGAEVVGCWGLTEPGHGSDVVLGPAAIGGGLPRLTARRDGADWVLDGQKSAWVSNGPVAAHCLLFVGIERGEGPRSGGVALVDLRAPGVARGRPWDKLGQRALPQGELFFDAVRIPGPQMIVADPETYRFALDTTLALANSAMGAIFTGVARAALDEALRWTRERVQGGHPIARHQVIQLKLSRMWQRVEAARALSRRVIAHNYATVTPSLPHAVAAKVHCTEAAYRNAHEAVQLLGAMGLARESDAEMIFRDARCALIEDGENDLLSLKLGGALALHGEA